MPHVKKLAQRPRHLKIVLVSSLIGLLAGGVTVAYRFALTYAEETAFAMYSFIQNHLAYLPLLFVGLAVVGYLLGLLTQRFPLIGGSGIPQVKGQIMGYVKGTWLGTLLAKFVGGTLAILGGLSLGREGPSIQLGACVAQGVARHCHTDEAEQRIYIASGASAGLAAAFNAPLAGVMFALEEIFRYFSPMILLSTMVSAMMADFVSKWFFGTEPVFHFAVTSRIPLEYYWLFLLLGGFLGVMGAVYNKGIVGAQKLYQRMTKVPPKFRIMIPMVVAGLVGVTCPVLLCGGHAIVEELSLTVGVLTLLGLFLGKFLFSMISFGSGAPGGIFFPLLILGATLGAVFAKFAIGLVGLDDIFFYNFIILAMAGYFTAIVRAPLTGVILLLEMTGSFAQLLPLILTSAVAYVVAEQLHSVPIYESLLENLLAKLGIETVEDEGKILVEAVVQMGSAMADVLLRDLTLPDHCLIVAIRRGEHEITPNGGTQIKAGDRITVLTDLERELDVQAVVHELAETKAY